MKTVRVLLVGVGGSDRKEILRQLEADQGFELVGAGVDIDSAAAALQSLRPEVVFLGLDESGAEAFALLDSISGMPSPVVVLLASVASHAARAFESRALDYLLKPFSAERFQQTLRRVHSALAARTPAWKRCLDEASAELQRQQALRTVISIRVDNRIVLVRLSEIEAIVADKMHCLVHTPTETHRTRRTVGEFEARLKSGTFVRINRSTIINADRVREISARAHGDGSILMLSGKEFPSSRRYRASWFPDPDP